MLVGAFLLSACTSGGDEEKQARSNPHAGGTLELGMNNPAFFALDPQYEYVFSTWELFRCCLLRTLMSYDGTSGVTGTEPKPDLASQPPDVSADGLTWTFHLRPGLHYGPPLENVPITSSDIVRALLRAGDTRTANEVLARSYLVGIQGFAEYLDGKADSISGLETPDPLTLRITQVRPDSTLPYEVTLPTTAPIPPSPADPSAPYGVATGHDRSDDPSEQNGYGRFLVSSGPYMIEGEGAVDFSMPPDQQSPASGFVPWRSTSHFQTKDFGSITLVRNPSWKPETDPLRQALADRIVLTGGRGRSLFRRFESGELDMVFDGTPPDTLLQRYLDDGSLRPYVKTLDGNNIVVADFNVARPPFDDPRVRRAVAYAMDRAAMMAPIRRAFGFASVVVANHYVNDAAEQSLASGWDPFPTHDGSPDLPAARQALSGSRYAKGGRCASDVCRHVLVEIRGGLDAIAKPLARTLSSLGIRTDVRVTGDLYGTCLDPSVPWGICIGGGWFPDFPSTGNGLVFFFGGSSVRPGVSLNRLGASATAIRKLNTPVKSVPSVDGQIQACQDRKSVV